MIIVTRAQMKFLNRGRALTLPTTSQYQKGRTYAVTTPGSTSGAKTRARSDDADPVSIA
jgi:hypothetical protein